MHLSNLRFFSKRTILSKHSARFGTKTDICTPNSKHRLWPFLRWQARAWLVAMMRTSKVSIHLSAHFSKLLFPESLTAKLAGKEVLYMAFKVVLVVEGNSY